MVCDKAVCEKWCVAKLYVKDGVWKMVCDKAGCERWCVTKMGTVCVTKLGVKDGVWQRWGRGGGRGGGRCRFKNENPTKFCGEKQRKNILKSDHYIPHQWNCFLIKSICSARNARNLNLLTGTWNWGIAMAWLLWMLGLWVLGTLEVNTSFHHEFFGKQMENWDYDSLQIP